MKCLFFIFFALCWSSQSMPAASQIDAAEIIQLIDAGKPIEFENITIRGQLDFTAVKDITEEESNSDQATYHCHIRTPITFIRCKFQGDIIAYVSHRTPNELYTPIFHEPVRFEDCQINGEFRFKYVRFIKGSDFPNTHFKDEINFKYTLFSKQADFSHVAFEDEVTFKYTRFPEYVDFTNAFFKKDACFKYTKFPEGVSFKNAVFDDDADFKYAQMEGPVNFAGVGFSGDANFKYTKVNGKSFTLHPHEK